MPACPNIDTSAPPLPPHTSLKWLPEHKNELETLMRFFISAAKQEMTAHVFLFTSESSFYGWLTERESLQRGVRHAALHACLCALQ